MTHPSPVRLSGIPLDLRPAGAVVLAADLAFDAPDGYVRGTVLASWRGEFVVWTVGAYEGATLECTNGEYHADAVAAWRAYAARR